MEAICLVNFYSFFERLLTLDSEIDHSPALRERHVILRVRDLRMGSSGCGTVKVPHWGLISSTLTSSES